MVRSVVPVEAVQRRQGGCLGEVAVLERGRELGPPGVTVVLGDGYGWAAVLGSATGGTRCETTPSFQLENRATGTILPRYTAQESAVPCVINWHGTAWGRPTAATMSKPPCFSWNVRDSGASDARVFPNETPPSMPTFHTVPARGRSRARIPGPPPVTSNGPLRFGWRPPDGRTSDAADSAHETVLEPAR